MKKPLCKQVNASMGQSLIHHTLEPVYDGSSRILLLGTMPSPKSREEGFYYMHPQNRFWPVLGDVLNLPVPQDKEGKRALLLQNHIALWDVFSSCKISGAADSSIRQPAPNDFSLIFTIADIRMVFTTGKTAQHWFERFSDRQSICLPSPSPANRRVSWKDLLKAYRQLLDYLD